MVNPIDIHKLTLEELSGMSPDELVEQRYRHFRDVKYFGEAKA